jgi:DNA-binding SARP family transcriptional activator/predicted ATPase
VGLSICLLGPFHGELDGERLSGFRSDKVRALLVYLAVEAHRPWTRATLAGLLWPDFPEQTAQSNLRNAISNLREVVGDRWREPPFLLVSQDTLQFNLNQDTWIDLQVFMDLVSSAGELMGSHDPRAQIGDLERALALYCGDFLEGFSIASAPFQEWALLKSEQIRQKVLEALRMLVSAYLEFGELDQALQHTRRWVELAPWDEVAHRYLMQICAHKGERSAALTQYEACCKALENELGVEPEPATVELYERIRSGQTLPSSSLPDSFHISHPVQLPHFLKGTQLPTAEGSFFVARQKELERLECELKKAVHGQGQVLFVTGDPGSGKTALLEEFTRSAMVKDPDLVVAWGQCNAYTGEGDPYNPFLEITQMLSGDVEARVMGGAITLEHARRLWRLVPQVISSILEEGPDLINRFVSGQDLLATAQATRALNPELLARLQSQIELISATTVRPRLQQVSLFNQFSKVLSGLSQHKPLVLILDDLQWIDTNSVNLLFHLVRRLSGSRILLLGAYRPGDIVLERQGERHPLEGILREFQASLGDIHIDLMENEGIDFVEAVLDVEPNLLSKGFSELLHRHTGGNPLFTIELLRGMQIKGDIYRNEQGKWVEGKLLNWDRLPMRVEAVIAERIGHLPKDYQDMLRTASVQGDLFTAEILASIQGREEQETLRILSQEIGKRHRLVVAQSRKRMRGQTISHYRFRHFLFQKYLYQQLDEVEKAHLHEKMGSALEAFYLQDLSKHPDITHQLARHFDLAGMLEKAVKYYTEAGKFAILLGANREAITHFERALHLIKDLPESEKRDGQSLSLHLSLGPPITALWGWAAPALELNYQQAEELCNKMADDPRLVPALWLLAVYRLGRSEHVMVDRLVERLCRLAKKIGDPILSRLASLQVSPLYQGKLREARQILSEASLRGEINQERSLAFQYGMSPAVVGQAYLGNCLWLMGFLEQAAQLSQEAIDLAEEINVPMTTCYALSRMCLQNAFAGEVEATRSQAEQLLQITRQHGLRNFELGAIFYIHWANALVGPPSAQDIERMSQSMEEYLNLGTVLNRTTFLILFALACSNAGQIERGLDTLEEAIALGERTGERWFEAEAYRVKGEFLAQLGQNSQGSEGYFEEAESCFQAARQVARQQGAKTLELRAVTSLCHLWHRQGRGAEGSQLLREIMSQFTEGVDGPDFSKAKSLLVILTDLTTS